MLKNLMEDKKIDLDAPLLSVRRFSTGAASPTTSASKREEGDSQPPPPAPRRVSLPFYKSDLKSGPVRVPGVVPFVWEQTPGRPKDRVAHSVGGDGKPLPVPKLPHGRISNIKERAAAAPSVKLGSSVRTRKDVTFAPDSGTAKHSKSSEDGPKIIVEERAETVEKEVNAERVDKGKSQTIEKIERIEEAEKGVRTENAKKADKPEKIEDARKVDKPQNITKAEKVENKPEKQPIPVVEKHDVQEDEDDEDAFSDALDTLSRTESFFMNCSISGLSGLPDTAKLSGTFPKDPHVRDFMMERFLPAAQAMACDSPQRTFRKGAGSPKVPAKPLERSIISDLNRRPAPIPYQNKLNYLPQYAKKLEEVDSYDENEEDDEYYEDSSNFPSKGCGLLPKFCMKSSFCLLNPVPGMKVRGRLPPAPRGRTGSPQTRNVHRVEDELSWEAAYGKNLVQEYHSQVEEISKLRSESNSPTADGSSPYVHSTIGGTPPDQNEGLPSSLHERNGSILSRESNSSKIYDSDAGEKDIGNYWEINHNNQLGSGSMSPALEKTLYVDSGDRPGSLGSKSSAFNIVQDTRSTMSSGEVGNESRIIEEGILAEAHESDALQQEVSKVSGRVIHLPSETLNRGSMNGDNYLKHGNGPLHLKNDLNPLQSLLPPPLPKSPSESWLTRTLPSVTSKNPGPSSLLGIQLQPRKQTLLASSIDMKQETDIKPPKPQQRQIRFAEVLAKPEFPKSEI
ncbi:hypothetical protein Cni_G23335 [Canna indica]|uniref:Uncharacterized protein n=1 Tax=Canna indica TaxID=4628 RepID=A0AAQ3KU71_9LILI|nr:hypothetical protein Cni_G23335 [Canna indica]